MSQGAFSFELSGFKDLTALLEELPTVSMQKTVLRNALKQAGQPIADAAKNAAPRTYLVKRRHLQDSIKVSTSLKASQRATGGFDQSKVTVYIGSSSPLAHLVEFGTQARVFKKPHVVKTKTGFVTATGSGRTRPNPFLRKAWDSMKMAALEIFRAQMEIQLLKAARRLANKAMKGTLTRAQRNGLS